MLAAGVSDRADLELRVLRNLCYASRCRYPAPGHTRTGRPRGLRHLLPGNLRRHLGASPARMVDCVAADHALRWDLFEAGALTPAELRRDLDRFHRHMLHGSGEVDLDVEFAALVVERLVSDAGQRARLHDDLAHVALAGVHGDHAVEPPRDGEGTAVWIIRA
ncbi:MAG: hypothetical protein KDC87_17110, partial [Planctomycetes bacterium]|nr:hypothetical protein [Planctomycetota bacterium]